MDILHTRLDDNDDINTEPVSLAEAKQYAEVDYDEHDGIIESLIFAARRSIESYCGVALTDQLWCSSLSQWPFPRPIASPLPKASDAVVSVWGETAFVEVESYFDEVASTVVPVTMPQPRGPGGIRVLWSYTNPTPNNALRAAILEMVAYMYENRGGADAGIPPHVLRMISPFRCPKV